MEVMVVVTVVALSCTALRFLGFQIIAKKRFKTTAPLFTATCTTGYILVIARPSRCMRKEQRKLLFLLLVGLILSDSARREDPTHQRSKMLNSRNSSNCSGAWGVKWSGSIVTSHLTNGAYMLATLIQVPAL